MHDILLLGGTGRTGQRVMEQLLGRGANVRAVVRSTDKLPTDAVKHPRLQLIEADLPSLSDRDLQDYVRGCDAVISCLGHNISLKGVFGPPHDLVAQTTRRVCRAIETLEPAEPVKFILMSSVSVHRLGRLDKRRGILERAFMGMIRSLLPPAMDNQRAADFLSREIGSTNAFIRWVVVRPDSLLTGDVSNYAVHEGLVTSLFAPAQTNMANVAHFMCELVADAKVWNAWSGKLPVIVNDDKAT